MRVWHGAGAGARGGAAGQGAGAGQGQQKVGRARRPGRLCPAWPALPRPRAAPAPRRPRGRRGRVGAGQGRDRARGRVQGRETGQQGPSGLGVDSRGRGAGRRPHLVCVSAEVCAAHSLRRVCLPITWRPAGCCGAVGVKNASTLGTHLPASLLDPAHPGTLGVHGWQPSRAARPPPPPPPSPGRPPPRAARRPCVLPGAWLTLGHGTALRGTLAPAWHPAAAVTRENGNWQPWRRAHLDQPRARDRCTGRLSRQQPPHSLTVPGRAGPLPRKACCGRPPTHG